MGANFVLSPGVNYGIWVNALKVFLSNWGNWKSTLGLKCRVHIFLGKQVKIHSPNWHHEKQPKVKRAEAIPSKYPCVPRCSCVTDKLVASSCWCMIPSTVYSLEEIDSWQNKSGTSSLACASAVSQSKHVFYVAV